MTSKAALLALMLALPLSARAQDATLRAVTGQVSILPAGQKKYLPASVGDALIFGDGVKTGAKSIAHLVLRDGQAILVQENSELTLRGDADNALIKFRIGEFLIGLAKKLGASQSFKVSTPAAVASVRGTLFWGKTDAAKNATFAGFGNQISVSAKGKTVTVGPGEMVEILYGSAPPSPKPHTISREYLHTFSVAGSLQGLETLVDKKIN